MVGTCEKSKKQKMENSAVAKYIWSNKYDK